MPARTCPASCTSTSAATTSPTSSSRPPSTSTPTKVGKDLGEAIWSGQNNTIKFAEVPAKLGVPVYRGMTHDGLGKYLKEKIEKAPGETADIVQILKDTHTDVVVSYLPVGSEQATKWYVEQVLEAGCGFVNCIPVFIAREDYWDKRFKKAGLPIVGDDIKSQVGATIVHRNLARLFHDRGVKLMRTSQLNVGGNMDFFNMLERERLESKKISKTNAVTSIMGHELPAGDVHVGPSDYVPWLTDRKWAHIRLEGQAFGDVPLTAELKLEVWDSPNSAGIVIDAVRCCKLALNHGIGGQLDGPSSYLMKSPHNQRPDDEAREDTETFIAQYTRRPGRSRGRTGCDAGVSRASRARAAAAHARRPGAGAAGCVGSGDEQGRQQRQALPRTPAPATHGRSLGSARRRMRATTAPRCGFPQDGDWKRTSYPELGADVRAIAKGLIALGVDAGERVAILSNTRAEWTLADFGAICAGAVVVPVYQTNSPEECEYVLEHSGSTVLFCEDEGQLEKLATIR